MGKKFYAVISKPLTKSSAVNDYVSHFDKFEKADKDAKEKKAILYEYDDKPLATHEHPDTRGTIIKDYSTSK